MALHGGVETAQVAEITDVAEVPEIAKIRLMSIIPDLVKADQLVGEGGGVLVARRPGRYARGGRSGRGFLRRVEGLVQVRPRGRMMTGGIMKMIKGIEGMLHRGYRVYRDRGYRREGRATVRMMIPPRRSGLRRLLPRIVLYGLGGGGAMPVTR